MRKKEKVIYCLQEMDEMFGDYPTTELEYETPFQLLTAVLLSAQTTDVQVNKVTKEFFRVFKSPHDGVTLGEKGIKQYIKTVGLHISKTKNLYKTCVMLTEHPLYKQSAVVKYAKNNTSIKPNETQFANAHELYEKRGYVIPDSLEELTLLPGVGVKTAKVVLSILYGHLQVAVDTHVHRVANRLGRVTTKQPLQTSKKLEKVIPDERKQTAHRVMIYFGRYHCRAKKPKCVLCPLQSVCRYYKSLEKTQ